MWLQPKNVKATTVMKKKEVMLGIYINSKEVEAKVQLDRGVEPRTSSLLMKCSNQLS